MKYRIFLPDCQKRQEFKFKLQPQCSSRVIKILKGKIDSIDKIPSIATCDQNRCHRKLCSKMVVKSVYQLKAVRLNC